MLYHPDMSSTREQRSAALKRAIEQVGGPSEVARYFDISTQAVSGWEVCPARRVLGLAELVKQKGGDVTAFDLFPELYPQAA